MYNQFESMFLYMNGFLFLMHINIYLWFTITICSTILLSVWYKVPLFITMPIKQTIEQVTIIIVMTLHGIIGQNKKQKVS